VTAGLQRAHNDLAGVDSDPDLNPRAAARAELITAAAKIVARREGGVNRALQMILVRDWCAEQREDAVAGRLHHVPVVAPHRTDHQLQRRIDKSRAPPPGRSPPSARSIP
jgi:hypothetical protein